MDSLTFWAIVTAVSFVLLIVVARMGEPLSSTRRKPPRR